MTYIDVINDKKINDIYLKIKNNSNYYMDHAIKHRDNVINYCKKLIDIFNIDKAIANNILIAASLHDIGRIKIIGEDNHAELSSIFAKEYLKDKIDSSDINFICNLISKHSGFKERTFYEEVLYFSDKMDFTKDRLEDNYRKKYEFVSILESLEEVLFEICDGTLVVKFITDGTISINDLVKEKRKYDIGIEYNVSSIAAMKNLSYRIYWDNNIIFEGNEKIELI